MTAESGLLPPKKKESYKMLSFQANALSVRVVVRCTGKKNICVAQTSPLAERSARWPPGGSRTPPFAPGVRSMALSRVDAN